MSSALIQYRKENNLSRRALAERVNVSRMTIYRWENGRRIDEEYLPRVSEITGIPRRELRPDLVALLDSEAAE